MVMTSVEYIVEVEKAGAIGMVEDDCAVEELL